MKKSTNTLLWIAFGLGMAIMVALLVLEYTKGARERAELKEVQIEEVREVPETTEETTTTVVTTTTVATTPETTTEVPTTTEETVAPTEEWTEPETWVEPTTEEWIEPLTYGEEPITEVEETEPVTEEWVEETEEYYPTGDVLTPSAGVVWFEGHMETYYDLPMAGVCDIMYSLGYEGEYWVRSDGCKMFGDYIMVAADFGWLPRGSVVLTSLGWGIVCDTGAGGWNWIDVATNWG